MDTKAKRAWSAAAAVVGLWLAGSARADLVGYWPLDGNATATVGTDGNPWGLPGPSATDDRNGVPGGAMAFNGAGPDFIEIPGGGGLDGQYVGTISLWVKWSGPQTGLYGDYGHYGTVLARQSNDVFTNNLISLSVADPAAAGVTWNSSGILPTITGTTPVGDNTWHHVAVTFQPHFTGVSELFLDGVSQGTLPGECLSISPTTSLTIGAWVGGEDVWGSMTGSVDDVAVFNDMLTPAQIAELAAQTKTPLDVGVGTLPDELPLRGVGATASTELLGGFMRFAANTTDGVGRGTTWPDGVSGQVDGMWLNNGTFAAPNDLDPWILFDLGEARPLAKMVVYNYNENYPYWDPPMDLTNRGSGEIEVFTSTDGVTFTSLGTYQLSQATGDGANPGQVVNLGGVVAQYVKLDILSGLGGDNNFVGLNEVDFYVGIPVEYPPGDADRDGDVDKDDAARLAANWLLATGASWSQGDFNDDGKVDDLDLAILSANWGTGLPTGAAVPEPCVLALCLAGLAMGLLRRRI
ncbi:MAG: hypothetical protein JW809_06030 [Pirellulales bacterium]|nr:hypothetical protein [Pirellulales bacterium]